MVLVRRPEPGEEQLRDARCSQSGPAPRGSTSRQKVPDGHRIAIKVTQVYTALSSRGPRA